MPLTKVTYQDYQTTISAQNLNDIQDAIKDLENAVDDIDTSGSGYTPPAGGIPLSDLASDVQTSIGKANTAVQGVKGDSETNYRTGTVNITKANIGLDKVENKTSAEIRGEITSQNVIDALGYTPGEGYGSMTASEAKTGTSQTAKVISASVLNAAIENKGYTANTGTITGITMNGESKGTSGVVNLGTVLTAHQDISGKSDKTATVSNVAYANNKITKTINGTTTDVVTVATLKTALSLSKSDVGLGNVDNTSDANKPVSTATQSALANKVDKVNGKGLSTNDYTATDKGIVDSIKNTATLEYEVVTQNIPDPT